MDQTVKEQFKEQLPPSCPPQTAGLLSSQVLMRLVPAENVVSEHFDSQAALGLKCVKKGMECAWASCSMILPTADKHRISALLKFKRLSKMKYLTYVTVAEASGRALIEESKHVHFWFFSGIDPVSLVQKTVKVSDYEPQ